MSSLSLAAALSAALANPARAVADTTEPPKALPAVIVAAPTPGMPRTQTQRLSAVELDRLGLGAELSTALATLPGVVGVARQNQAQDTGLIYRGFGARASFGTRGIRIEQDGIPASFADGQGQLGGIFPGQLSGVSLTGGPYAAIDGLNAGVVVRATTRIPRGSAATIAAQDDGSTRLQVETGTQQDDWRGALYALSSRDRGPRAYGDSERRALSALLGWQDRAGDWRVKADLFDQPTAEDPGTLTLAQFAAAPGSVNPVALAVGAGKSITQRQLGLSYASVDDARQWQAAVFVGRRDVVQVLGISPALQSSRPGLAGLLDLNRHYGGARLGYQWLGERLTWRGFATIEAQHDRRLGFENFAGNNLGVRGRLKRDEDTDFTTLGIGQALQWRVDANWQLDAGWRWNQQNRRLRSLDGFGSGDINGATGFVGLRRALGPGRTLSLSAGRSLETPTATELANQPDGATGLNTTLRPARGRPIEVGFRQHWAGGAAQLVGYRIDTQDEIVVVENLAGRAVFGNAGQTRRQGIEASVDHRLSPAWRVGLRAALADARYRGTAPCTPSCAADGDALPLSPRVQGSWTLGWRRAEHQVELRGLHRSSMIVDERTQTRIAGQSQIDLSYRYQPRRDSWSLRASVDDVFDNALIGGIAVNDSNGRYIDPAKGRTLRFDVRLPW